MVLETSILILTCICPIRRVIVAPTTIRVCALVVIKTFMTAVIVTMCHMHCCLILTRWGMQPLRHMSKTFRCTECTLPIRFPCSICMCIPRIVSGSFMIVSQLLLLLLMLLHRWCMSHVCINPLIWPMETQSLCFHAVVYTHLPTHAHKCTHIPQTHTHAHARTHTKSRFHIEVHTFTNMEIHTNKIIIILSCWCIYTSNTPPTHTHTHTHTHTLTTHTLTTHTHTHTHIHTHTHNDSRTTTKGMKIV